MYLNWFKAHFPFLFLFFDVLLLLLLSVARSVDVRPILPTLCLFATHIHQHSSIIHIPGNNSTQKLYPVASPYILVAQLSLSLDTPLHSTSTIPLSLSRSRPLSTQESFWLGSVRLCGVTKTTTRTISKVVRPSTTLFIFSSPIGVASQPSTSPNRPTWNSSPSPAAVTNSFFWMNLPSLRRCPYSCNRRYSRRSHIFSPKTAAARQIDKVYVRESQTEYYISKISSWIVCIFKH